MKHHLLKQLQTVDLESPEEALALLERVKTPSSTADDRERLAGLIRVTRQVIDQLRAVPEAQRPPLSKPCSPTQKTKRNRQVAKAARRRQRR